MQDRCQHGIRGAPRRPLPDRAGRLPAGRLGDVRGDLLHPGDPAAAERGLRRERRDLGAHRVGRRALPGGRGMGVGAAVGPLGTTPHADLRERPRRPADRDGGAGAELRRADRVPGAAGPDPPGPADRGAAVRDGGVRAAARRPGDGLLPHRARRRRTARAGRRGARGGRGRMAGAARGARRAARGERRGDVAHPARRARAARARPPRARAQAPPAQPPGAHRDGHGRGRVPRLRRRLLLRDVPSRGAAVRLGRHHERADLRALGDGRPRAAWPAASRTASAGARSRWR